jgi:hypothetical protein
MAQGDYNTNNVRHIEHRAQYLANHRARAQTVKTAAHSGLQRKRDRHKDTHEGNDLGWRQAVLPDPLDATVAEHPAGESKNSKEDGGQVGDAGFHRDSSRRVVRDGEKLQENMM